MKVPTRSLAFLVGGLMLGTALAPVGAQQIAPADGQLAVRSDGAVYLIINAQRRWVPTVQITDEELNAYPEGEPIYAGLAPIGAQTTTTAARVSGSPTATTAPAAAPAGGTTGAAPASGAAGSTTTTASASRTPTTTTAASTTPTTATGSTTAPASNVDPNLPIEVDIEGPAKFEPGERIIVHVRVKTGVSCELTVQWPGGREASEENKTSDSRGRCRYSIEIPDNAPVGVGLLKGAVREGGRVSTQDVEFEIVQKN